MNHLLEQIKSLTVLNYFKRLWRLGLALAQNPERTINAWKESPRTRPKHLIANYFSPLLVLYLVSVVLSYQYNALEFKFSVLILRTLFSGVSLISTFYVLRWINLSCFTWFYHRSFEKEENELMVLVALFPIIVAVIIINFFPSLFFFRAIYFYVFVLVFQFVMTFFPHYNTNNYYIIGFSVVAMVLPHLFLWFLGLLVPNIPM